MGVVSLAECLSKQQNRTEPKAIIIEAHSLASTPSAKRAKQAWLLLSPYENDSDLISPGTVSLLGLSISYAGQALPQAQHNGQAISIQGYVELSWNVERGQAMYRNWFAVTSDASPPFDCVLGPRSAIACGLM